MTIEELPDSELDVMSCLWVKSPMTVREIRDALEQRRPMAHATVCTLLKRLESKRFVSREKSGVGKSFQYQAEIKPKGTARKLLNNVLQKAFAGNGIALVAALFESQAPSASELEELTELLKQLMSKQS